MSFRRTLRRSINWGRLATGLEGEEAKAKVTLLRAYYGQIENLERKYPSAPAPIDWETYKSTVQTPGVVDELKKSFEAISYPTPAPEDFEGMSAGMSANKTALAADIAGLKEAITGLEERVAFEEANKTNEETTLEDWAAKYPEQYAEAEAEVSNHEWFSGVVVPYGADAKEESH